MTEAEQFLYETVPKTSAMVFQGSCGLEKSRRFLAELGDPQNTRPAIHIAATSGKGTIACMLEAILLAHGFTTATITSPHVYSILERTRLDGQAIAATDFLARLNEILPVYKLLAASGQSPTYFELNTALGFAAAAQAGVDYVIVETGMGGLLDTTNTIGREDKLSVIGQIGYDHTHILGDSLEEIATHKAGIISPGQTAIALWQDLEVNQVIQKRAAAQSTSLMWTAGSEAEKQIPGLALINGGLYGRHQYDNLALALGAAKALAKRDQWTISVDAVKLALAQVQLSGRFEHLVADDMDIILDGAHNEQKITATLAAFTERFPGVPFGAVFASGQQKNPLQLANLLDTVASQLILTEYHATSLDMYRPAYDFQTYAQEKGHLLAREAPEVVQAMRQSGLKYWLVTGSFYILADVRKALLKH